MDVIAALQELAEPYPPGDKVKAAIARAAKRILVPSQRGKLEPLSYWRAFDIWYGKARRIEKYERAAIVEAVEKKRREATRNELHELKLRLARLESRLVQTDEDFHREDIAAFGFALPSSGQRGGRSR